MQDVMTARSKVEQVSEQIRARIRDGRLGPGQRLPPERDLAREFGVSHPTLNKAMASLAAEGLLDRSVGRGTHVRSDIPAGLVLLAMDAPRLDHGGPYYRTVFEQCRQVVEAVGLRVQCLIAFGDTPAACAASLALDAPSRREARAVVAIGPSRLLRTVVAAAGLPLVVVGIDPALPLLVRLDYAALLHLAVASLAARGCRRPALLSHEGSGSASGMVEHFHAGLRAAGIDPAGAPALVHPLGVAGGLAAARAVAALDPRPDGVVVGDENLLPGFLAGLEAVGLQAGRDLAIVSHATPDAGEVPPAGVELIGFPAASVAAAATELLRRALVEGIEARGSQVVAPVVHPSLPA